MTASHPAWLADPVAAADRGENPTVIARLRSGYAVIGLTQFLPGYSLLLGAPKAPSLEALPLAARGAFLLDMALLGEAVFRATGCLRMNYEILGNTDGYLHAHLFPRYGWEEDERRRNPVWQYPRDRWTDPQWAFEEARHGDLRARIGAELCRLLAEAGRTPA